MESMVVAVPSDHPGGLDAALGAHFGHCDLYTLVKITEGKVLEVATLANVPHEQGGCMAPVKTFSGLMGTILAPLSQEQGALCSQYSGRAHFNRP